MENNFREKRIFLVGSLHGDEDLGDDLWNFILKKYPKLSRNIDFILGNPRARRFYTRLIESDLNRSFVPENFAKTYEEKRAQILSEKFREGNYDLILDFHTTTVAGEPIFVSTENRTELVKNFAKNSFIRKIVVMPPKIADVSLIGNFSNAISVEINREDAKKDEILKKIVGDIQSFLGNLQVNFTKNPSEVYEVFSYFGNNEFNEKEIENAENFVKFPEKDVNGNEFYPVLLGEKTYRQMGKYIGFKAKKRA